MTPWDIRASLRALGATVLGLIVVWLVTAASDEGQLTVGARASRTLPLAPLCSAVGAALALGTARVRQESGAFEALGRSPSETGRAAAFGAALPSILVAIAIAAVPGADIDAFYPRAVHGDSFTYTEEGFVSSSLGVRIDADGEAQAIEEPTSSAIDELPRGARAAAAVATACAGLALSFVVARAALRRSLLDERGVRRLRMLAAVEAFGCALLTLIAFQSAAVGLSPPMLAIVPPLVLLIVTLVRSRLGDYGTFRRAGA